MEYKLMTKEELTNYIYDFWYNFGCYDEFFERDEKDIKEEIKEDLSNDYGIEKELDAVRLQYENYDEEDWEYDHLDELWNYLNWYKTNFDNKGDV